MCEPKAGIGLMFLDLAVGTKAGRRTIGAVATLGCLYASTQIAVTVPLIAVLGPAIVAVGAIAAALLYRQRSMASAAVANATRQELATARAHIKVRRVRELEAAKPVLEALPVAAVQECA